MKNILIYTQDLIPNTLYMHDKYGRMDLLGQLLFTGYKISIPVNTRTPQDLEKAINHFVVCHRQRSYSNTQLTLTLLSLSSLPGKRQVTEANKVLLPFSINLLIAELEDQRIKQAADEAIKARADEIKRQDDWVKAKGVVKYDFGSTSSLTLSELSRTSWHFCSGCKNNQVISSIQEKNTSDKYNCGFCLRPLDPDFIRRILQRFPE